MASHLRVVGDDRTDTTDDTGPTGGPAVKPAAAPVPLPRKPGLSENQARWLRRGLDQPGGKLPLFDEIGKRVSDRTVKSCLEKGWAKPWFTNPMKPDWLVCKLTDEGRALFSADRID